VVEVISAQEFRLGDIVLARQGDLLVLHRLVAKRNGTILTKGDSRGFLDGPLTRDQILGRAVARERQGRIRRLDYFWARFLGLAWCLSLPWIPGLLPFLAAMRRKLGGSPVRSREQRLVVAHCRNLASFQEKAQG
jgi:hypothetical protein